MENQTMVGTTLVNGKESKKVIWLPVDKWRAKLTFYLQYNNFIKELKLWTKLKKY